MIQIEWLMLGFGALAGAVSGAVFFAGLAWGMRLALRAGRPTTVLLLSGVLRIGALLGVGWLVASVLGASGFIGFALAFLLVRTGILAIARRPVGGVEAWK